MAENINTVDIVDICGVFVQTFLVIHEDKFKVNGELPKIFDSSEEVFRALIEEAIEMVTTTGE